MTSTATHVPTVVDVLGRYRASTSMQDMLQPSQLMQDMLQPLQRLQEAAESWQRLAADIDRALEPARAVAAAHADLCERLSASLSAPVPMAWAREAARYDRAKARRVARIRREALSLAHGSESLAVEVRRILRDLLARDCEYTAGLLAAALADPQSEAAGHVREMAADSGDIGDLARRVLAIIEAVARFDARAERVMHRLAVECVLARRSMRRGPGPRPCEPWKEPPPSISVRGCIERNGPPSRAPGAHAARAGHVLRDAHTSGSPPT